MIEKRTLGLEEARIIVEAMLEAATKKPGGPSSFAVVDNSGIPIYLARMDGASPLTVRVAINKAYSAIDTQWDTKDMFARIQKLSEIEKVPRDIGWWGEPRLSAIPGGVLVKSSDGSIVGAVGTSGRTADEDEELARIGASAVNV